MESCKKNYIGALEKCYFLYVKEWLLKMCDLSDLEKAIFSINHKSAAMYLVVTEMITVTSCTVHIIVVNHW